MGTERAKGGEGGECRQEKESGYSERVGMADLHWMWALDLSSHQMWCRVLTFLKASRESNGKRGCQTLQ